MKSTAENTNLTTPVPNKHLQALKPQELHPKRKRISLALQGGGAHGAFTWGVIDKLLEDGRLEIGAVIGTSAGAMNATVLAYGLEIGGPSKAQELLKEFWELNSRAGRAGPMQATWMDKLVSRGNLDFSPLYHWLDNLTRLFSPYQLNPLNLNPLKELIQQLIDFNVLSKAERIKLFICATSVLDARLRVFDHSDISADAVTAAACSPFLFQAVEIDGNFYWDGGYLGNPPIFPLIENTDIPDILVIQSNPIRIPDVPRTASTILDRINSLSFNASLMHEMRAVQLVNHLIDHEGLDPKKYKRTFIHTIDAELELSPFSVSSKMNPDLKFLHFLFEMGHRKASDFLRLHFDKIGRQSSTNIEEKFL